MKRYKIRDGIVLETIAGRYLLISTSALNSECPYVKMINDLAAYYWELIVNGFSFDEMINKASQDFSIDDREELENDLNDLINELYRFGYLVSEESSE